MISAWVNQPLSSGIKRQRSFLSTELYFKNASGNFHLRTPLLGHVIRE